MEFCPQKTLSDLVKIRESKKRGLKEFECRYFMNQLLEATKYMQDNSVIHRDLKLPNVFLSADMTVKIGDFGLAQTLPEYNKMINGQCGTPGYMAPEIIEGQLYSYEVDVWALGIFMYQMIVGRQPFESKKTVKEDKIKEIYEKTKACVIHIPTNEERYMDGKDPISNEASDLIK